MTILTKRTTIAVVRLVHISPTRLSPPVPEDEFSDDSGDEGGGFVSD
jgi:hypothetical protein